MYPVFIETNQPKWFSLLPIPYNPCMVYLPTFGWFFMVNVGKYTSPMDPMGIEDDTKLDVLSQSVKPSFATSEAASWLGGRSKLTLLGLPFFLFHGPRTCVSRCEFGEKGEKTQESNSVPPDVPTLHVFDPKRLMYRSQAERWRGCDEIYETREIKCIQRYDIYEIYVRYMYIIYFVLHSHSVVSELFHASSGAIVTCNQASHNWKPTKQTWKCLTSASFSCFTVSWQTGVHIKSCLPQLKS